MLFNSRLRSEGFAGKGASRCALTPNGFCIGGNGLIYQQPSIPENVGVVVNNARGSRHFPRRAMGFPRTFEPKCGLASK